MRFPVAVLAPAQWPLRFTVVPTRGAECLRHGGHHARTFAEPANTASALGKLTVLRPDNLDRREVQATALQ